MCEHSPPKYEHFLGKKHFRGKAQLWETLRSHKLSGECPCHDNGKQQRP